MTDNNPSTTTRASLSSAVYDSTKIPLQEASRIVDATIEEMVNMLVENKALKLSGFGSFKTHRKQPRIGRNPKTGVEAKIDSRTVISFTPSNLFKSDVNKSLADK